MTLAPETDESAGHAESSEALHARLSEVLGDFLNLASSAAPSERARVHRELTLKCALLEQAALAASASPIASRTGLAIDRLIKELESPAGLDQHFMAEAEKYLSSFTENDGDAS
jgi:hypothetical protein